MGYGKPILATIVCAGIGETPETAHYLDRPKKMPTQLIIAVISTILHVFVNTKIYLFTRNEEAAAESIQLGTSDNQADETRNKPQQTMQQKIFSKSMVDFGCQILLVCGIISWSIPEAIQNILGLSFFHEENLLGSLLFLKTVWRQIVVLAFCTVNYCRNDGLQEFLRRKFASYQQQNNP